MTKGPNRENSLRQAIPITTISRNIERQYKREWFLDPSRGGRFNRISCRQYRSGASGYRVSAAFTPSISADRDSRPMTQTCKAPVVIGGWEMKSGASWMLWSCRSKVCNTVKLVVFSYSKEVDYGNR
jgi:hypothetical protein